MNKQPSFYNISWAVIEEEYRADPALSYSILSKYERSGFNDLDNLFDKIETPSLTFGSAVDSLITGGREEFDSRFCVVHFPSISPSMMQIAKTLYTRYYKKYREVADIPDTDIINLTEEIKFYPNWKPETRVNAIRKDCAEYYRLVHRSQDKVILTAAIYSDVLNTVDALKTSEATKWYFQADNPFENIERLYQLKFKARLNGILYRCMADLIIVDYDNKTVQPVDLKTSSKKEWDFYKSFIDWRYDLQARLYWRIIRACMDADEYFKDFTLLPYRFIVANKFTLVPLVWEFPFTEVIGTLKVGKQGQIELRDPFEIGAELDFYLKHRPKVPAGISLNGVNNLTTWLNKI